MSTITCHQNATSKLSPHHGCDCTDPVHQHPTPIGYQQAMATAEERLAVGWLNVPCVLCDHFGWVPPSVAAAWRACS